LPILSPILIFYEVSIAKLVKQLKHKILEGSGYFFHDKLIAPVLPTGRGLLPPGKAKHGVGSCWRAPFKQPAVKCEAVAAVRLGRQHPGILS
jgi:hypothetical protein